MAVAPHVGAWIETSVIQWTCRERLSHPMWVRGLKPFSSSMKSMCSMSHPMWVRGLKHRVGEPTGDKSKSHPMWVRGLKRRGHVATDTTDQSYLVHYFL